MFNRKTNRIEWVKWKDPIKPLTATVRKIKQIDPDFDTDHHIATQSFADDEEVHEYEVSNMNGGLSYSGAVMNTPMGMIPIHEDSLPSNIFNFWVAYTNFSLTRDIVKVLNAHDGVEALTILTPYRFRIAVGRLFNETEVMNSITKKFCGANHEKDV